MKLFSGCMKTRFACTITLTLTKTGQQAVRILSVRLLMNAITPDLGGVGSYYIMNIEHGLHVF